VICDPKRYQLDHGASLKTEQGFPADDRNCLYLANICRNDLKAIITMYFMSTLKVYVFNSFPLFPGLETFLLYLLKFSS